MIDVALVSVIRPWYLRDGVKIREIARRTSSPGTRLVSIWRAASCEPRYPKRLSPSKLDPYRSRSWRRGCSGGGDARPQAAAQLAAVVWRSGALGTGGPTIGSRRLPAPGNGNNRKRNATSRGTFVPLTFALGEAFQFDWSGRAGDRGVPAAAGGAHEAVREPGVLAGGVPAAKGHEMLFDAHNRALAALGGVPKRGRLANATGADLAIGAGVGRATSSCECQR